MRPGNLAAATLLGLALAGCGSSAGTPDAPSSPDSRSATRASFEQARAHWRSLALVDYRYSFRRSCFCVPAAISEVEILVRSGQVTQVFYADTGQAVSPDGYPTVDGLFETLQRAFDDGAYEIRAAYDPGRGYPTDFYIDTSPQIADEELGVQARDLRPAE
jgi:hypothetical protein